MFLPSQTLIMMVTYSMGRDEKNFDRPNDFVPERWFRGRESVEDREAAINSHYATIPFAFGPRCCVGRRKITFRSMKSFKRFCCFVL